MINGEVFLNLVAKTFQYLKKEKENKDIKNVVKNISKMSLFRGIGSILKIIFKVLFV